MRTKHLSLSLIVVLAAACASSADRARTQPTDHPPGADQTADTRQADTDTTATGTAQPALMVVGVYVESPLAAACGITLPPTAFFEYDSARLDAASNPSLQALARCLTSGPLAGRSIELVGHTDPRGGDEYNRQLGRSRAESVRDFLQGQGVPTDRLVARSMGEQAAEPATPSQWPLERRVDIRLLPE